MKRSKSPHVICFIVHGSISCTCSPVALTTSRSLGLSLCSNTATQRGNNEMEVDTKETAIEDQLLTWWESCPIYLLIRSSNQTVDDADPNFPLDADFANVPRNSYGVIVCQSHQSLPIVGSPLLLGLFLYVREMFR